MSEEYYPERYEKIYPEREELIRFEVRANISRKGKTAKLESVDNPASVFYCQFHELGNMKLVYAQFEVPRGNYILTITGEDRRENVTVFPRLDNIYEW